jgi:hypothetical protein
MEDRNQLRPEVGTGLGDGMTLFHTHPFTPFQTPEELERLLSGGERDIQISVFVFCGFPDSEGGSMCV